MIVSAKFKHIDSKRGGVLEKCIEPLLGFKIFDELSHAEDFTRGKLLVRQLRYFRKIEDKSRKDEKES